MNCCDEYGNCRQGRDCPVRMKKCDDVEMDVDLHDGADELLLIFTVIIGITTGVLAILILLPTP